MNHTLSRHIGKFLFDRRVLMLLVLASLFVAGRAWLAEHPEHNPWAPLSLDDPKGWATQQKLLALRDDVPACRAVLKHSDVEFNVLDPAGDAQNCSVWAKKLRLSTHNSSKKLPGGCIRLY